MVYFNHSYKDEDQSLRMNYLFYFATILLAATVLSYLVFNFKVQLQGKLMRQIETASLSLRSDERQVYNRKILDYKKKIDDFAEILGSHRINSNVFNFIEKNTLKNVWFSNFSVQETANEIMLSGEASDMKTVSNQIEIFEKNKEYVLKVNVLNYHVNATGKVNFSLNISLNSEAFNNNDDILHATDNKIENNS